MALHMSYTGDVSTNIIGRVMGPDTAGGYVVAVTAQYTPADIIPGGPGTTRVGFAPLRPGETRVTCDEFEQVCVTLEWLNEYANAFGR